MNNRPIKFRVWSKQHIRWMNRCSAIDCYGHTLILYYEQKENEQPSPIVSFYQPDTIVVQQFTGSLDKNNNPIYESDIVLWDQQDPFDCTPSKAKKVVGWNQRCMQFRLYNHPTEIGQSGGEEFLAEDVVVIGNIFDWKNEECRYFLDESVKE